MIQSLLSLAASAHPSPRKVTYLDFGLGIKRDSQCFGVFRTLDVDFLEIVENGVGFGNLFLGWVLRTRRKQ